MRQFILKTLLFLLPLLPFVAEVVLPLNFFTYRLWEALMYTTNGFRFFPNKRIDMITQGDLCHNTPHAIQRNELWITDQLGYRNNTFINDPDVVLIGDSFIAGCSLTQDATLTNQLSRLRKDVTFYNMAPASFTDFKCLIEQKIIRKPKIVVFSIVERHLPDSISYKECPTYRTNLFYEYRSRLTRLYMKEYVNARLTDEGGGGFQSPTNEKMFFHSGINHRDNLQHVSKSSDILKSYKTYLDSLGIGFIFLPLPDKETLYYPEVPLTSPSGYLPKLVNTLRNQHSIVAINTLDLLNARMQTKGERLYQYDDSHWNPTGVRVVADALAKELTTGASARYLRK